MVIRKVVQGDTASPVEVSTARKGPIRMVISTKAYGGHEPGGAEKGNDELAAGNCTNSQ